MAHTLSYAHTNRHSHKYIYIYVHTYIYTYTDRHAPFVAAVADRLEFPGYFLRGSRGERVGLNTLDPMRSGRTAICTYRKREKRRG
jgi:hypothetical protein